MEKREGEGSGGATSKDVESMGAPPGSSEPSVPQDRDRLKNWRCS